MPLARRYFISKMPHELCLRVRSGLPFPAWLAISLLLKSAMARAAREAKVTICHYLLMANHLHMLLVVHDPNQCKEFYGELKKKITDYVKRLRGLEHLELWDGRPMVAPILDADKCAERVAYFYANSAKANLTDRIEDYPGLSSWQDFQSGQSRVVHTVPWIRCPAIEPLKGDVISEGMDKSLVQQWTVGAKEFEELVVEPNAWIECFKLTESERINSSIVKKLREKEQEYRTKRVKAGLNVIGRRRLIQGTFFKAHKPARNDRNIFVLSSIDELRIAFIDRLKKLDAKCRELWAARRLYCWPPGLFPPAGPPVASAFA